MGLPVCPSVRPFFRLPARFLRAKINSRRSSSLQLTRYWMEPKRWENAQRTAPSYGRNGTKDGRNIKPYMIKLLVAHV